MRQTKFKGHYFTGLHSVYYAGHRLLSEKLRRGAALSSAAFGPRPAVLQNRAVRRRPIAADCYRTPTAVGEQQLTQAYVGDASYSGRGLQRTQRCERGCGPPRAEAAEARYSHLLIHAASTGCAPKHKTHSSAVGEQRPIQASVGDADPRLHSGGMTHYLSHPCLYFTNYRYFCDKPTEKK